MNNTWNDIERDVLDVLTRKVRMLSHEQALELWGEGVVSLLERLRRAELVQRYCANVHPRLRPSRPVLATRPEQSPRADCYDISMRLKRRWSKSAKPMILFTASPLSANIYGSTARKLPPLLHRAHDLLLADVYLHYRRHHDRLAADWLSEDTRGKAGWQIKDPDAFLVRDGRPYRVVESGGSYSAGQVDALLKYCRNRQFALEIW